MEWFEFVSSYEPSNPHVLTWYDQFRLLADHYRYWIIFIYLVAVYYMGFATRIRMPILKTMMLYVVLLIGAVVFAILDTTLPVRAGLFTAIVILLIVKFRVNPDMTKRG